MNQSKEELLRKFLAARDSNRRGMRVAVQLADTNRGLGFGREGLPGLGMHMYVIAEEDAHNACLASGITEEEINAAIRDKSGVKA